MITALVNIMGKKLPVMIRLSNQQFDKVYDTLQSETKQMIDNKYPCSNGGWIHFRVLTKEHLEDIKILLSAKCCKNK